MRPAALLYRRSLCPSRSEAGHKAGERSQRCLWVATLKTKRAGISSCMISRMFMVLFLFGLTANIGSLPCAGQHLYIFRGGLPSANARRNCIELGSAEGAGGRL